MCFVGGYASLKTVLPWASQVIAPLIGSLKTCDRLRDDGLAAMVEGRGWDCGLALFMPRGSGLSSVRTAALFLARLATRYLYDAGGNRVARLSAPMPGSVLTSPDTLELTLREGQGKELVRLRKPNQQIHIAVGPKAPLHHRSKGI